MEFFARKKKKRSTYLTVREFSVQGIKAIRRK